MNIFERLNEGVSSNSAEETQAIAAEFARSLPINQTLKLSGTLGTGKTTFVQGLARAWSIEESVKSPTFNLYSIYQGQRQLIHVDAYRLTHPSQADDLLIEEFLRPPFCLAVEWPEKVDGWMEDEAWHFRFSIEENHDHWIILEQKPT